MPLASRSDAAHAGQPSRARRNSAASSSRPWSSAWAPRMPAAALDASALGDRSLEEDHLRAPFRQRQGRRAPHHAAADDRDPHEASL